MRAKWRFLILFAYIVFLIWHFAGVGAWETGAEAVSFMTGLLFLTLAPVAILCLVPWHEPAMGIAAMVVATFGVWAYNANDGDPIGLLIVLFYQFCMVGIAFLAIVGGASFLERWR